MQPPVHPHRAETDDLHSHPPNQRALSRPGEIEQVRGRMDLPPFAPTGTATSFFDVFVELHVGGQTLRPATPLHMTSVIRNKPPRPGDEYINPFTQPVPLLDAAGNPTGIYIVREVHTPDPTNPPPVEIDHFPRTTAQISAVAWRWD